MPGQFDSPARRTGTFWSREVFDEAGRPQTATDPTWHYYSSVVTSTEPSPGKEFGLRSGLSNLDPIDKNQALEDHELAVSYELERFPVDTAGDPIDPVGDAGVLDEDNAIATTHSFLQEVQFLEVAINNTMHEKWFGRSDVEEADHPSTTDGYQQATAYPTRKFIYGRGGIPEEVTLGIDADDNALMTAEISYRFEKIRPYQIDQPQVTDSYLHVTSTSANDTDVSFTLETVDGTGEELTLSATDPVNEPTVSTDTYADLGAVRVHDEHEGTILVWEDDDSGAGVAGEPGQLLTIVKGHELYDGIEHDRGLPLLGAGSFATPDTNTLEEKQYAIGAEVFWEGIPLADYHQGSEITIGFDVEEAAATNTGLSHTYSPSARNIEIETSVFGETVSDDMLSDFLEGRDGELDYQVTGGNNIRFPLAHINEGGPGERSDGDAFVMPESTFVAKRDVAGGREAIEFVRPA